jgi:hypothetical protein
MTCKQFVSVNHTKGHKLPHPSDFYDTAKQTHARSWFLVTFPEISHRITKQHFWEKIFSEGSKVRPVFGRCLWIFVKNCVSLARICLQNNFGYNINGIQFDVAFFVLKVFCWMNLIFSFYLVWENVWTLWCTYLWLGTTFWGILVPITKHLIDTLCWNT